MTEQCIKCGSRNVIDSIKSGDSLEPIFNRIDGIKLSKYKCENCSSVSTYRDDKLISHTEGMQRIKHNDILLI